MFYILLFCLLSFCLVHIACKNETHGHNSLQLFNMVKLPPTKICWLVHWSWCFQTVNLLCKWILCVMTHSAYRILKWTGGTGANWDTLLPTQENYWPLTHNTDKILWPPPPDYYYSHIHWHLAGFMAPDHNLCLIYERLCCEPTCLFMLFMW